MAEEQPLQHYEQECGDIHMDHMCMDHNTLLVHKMADKPLQHTDDTAGAKPSAHCEQADQPHELHMHMGHMRHMRHMPPLPGSNDVANQRQQLLRGQKDPRNMQRSKQTSSSKTS